MPTVNSLRAIEILDSRGRPTIKVTCTLADGARASASVPSGASTGRAEAWELRDGDPARYRGMGCRNAASNVNTTITGACAGKSFSQQQAFDTCLIDLDGTANKANLGANAILGCSLAFCRAQAKSRERPLYRHFSELVGGASPSLPRISVNLFSGGKHAGEQVSIQDILIVPVTDSIDGALSATYEVYQSAAELCHERYKMRRLTADEGGLAPPCKSCDELFDLAEEAVDRAGLSGQVKLAVDVAASHFEQDGMYLLDGQTLSGKEMVDRIERWVTSYPLVSVEDALAEDDWQHWSLLVERLGTATCLIGDDLLCTNSARIARAINERAANGLLLKVNQIGTLSEAAAAFRLARDAVWKVIISARSGETEDNWLADLAVGWNGDFIKVGSITQSDRLAKYNRLLEIEQEWTAP